MRFITRRHCSVTAGRERVLWDSDFCGSGHFDQSFGSYKIETKTGLWTDPVLGTAFDRYTQRLNRAETSESIQFYENVYPYFEPYLDERFHIYHDVRMYFPESDHWYASSAFEMLNYAYITSEKFDALFLMQQRFDDYLNPNVVAIDEGKLEEARVFYRDADRGAIEGYDLVYRDQYGLFYIRTGIQP